MNGDEPSPEAAGPRPAQEWHPAVNPWLITVAVMIGTFMEVLDTSVANVALPHMAGSLSATNDEATWVLTSYLVSNAIILPTTGWLSRFFGRKRFLMTCIAIFTVASLFCGAALSLGMLIAARILQGAGGGALQPLAQSIILESFPPAKRGAAMAAFAVGVVCAPIIGPTLGGWITDNYSWRWIFYINGPVGVLGVLMVRAFVEDPPYIKNAMPGRIDYIGFGLMALWLATLQIILDKGQEDDWFSADWIRWFAVISSLSFLAFLAWELTTREPIVNLRILTNRNFWVGTLLIFIVGSVLYGTLVMLPLFLQQLMGYPALNSGLAVSPRGLGSLLVLPLIGRISGRVDNRYLLIGGFILLAGANLMLGDINLSISITSVIIPNVIGGAALAFLFVPLTTMTMGTLSNEQIGNASGIYNLMRNIGGSVGISAVTTLLARGAQTHQALMVGHLSVFDTQFQARLAEFQQFFAPQFGPVRAELMANQALYNILLQQASLLSFVDAFRLFGYLCVICIPLVLVFKRVKFQKGPVAVH